MRLQITVRKRPDRPGYRVDLHHDGQRYRIGQAPIGGFWTPLHTRDLAELVRGAIRSAVAEGASVEQAVAPFLRRPTAATLVPTKLAAWYQVLEEREAAGDLSPTTLAFYKRHGKPGGPFSFFDQVHVFAIRYGTLEDWRSWLHHRGVAPASAAKALETFRTFLRWLHRRGDLPAVPAFPTVPRTEHVPTIATPAGQRAILDAIPWELRGVFLAMAHTLRPGEARALELRDYRDGDLVVRRACKGTAAGAPVREAKERNWRVIGADEELQRWCEERLASAPPAERLEGLAPLFPNPRARHPSRRWAHSALWGVWRDARKAAGVPDVALYEGTKHTTSTDLIRSKVATMEELQALLGHRERRSTRVYGRLAERDVAELVRRRKR